MRSPSHRHLLHAGPPGGAIGASPLSPNRALPLNYLGFLRGARNVRSRPAGGARDQGAGYDSSLEGLLGRMLDYMHADARELDKFDPDEGFEPHGASGRVKPVISL